MVVCTQRIGSRSKKNSQSSNISPEDSGATILPSEGVRSKRGDNAVEKEKAEVLFAKEKTKEEVQELSSTTREKWIIRNTPVVNAKYLPVWKRVKAKIKAKFFMKDLNRELQLFGASTIAVDNEDLKLRLDKAMRKRASQIFQWREISLPVQFPMFVLTPTHWFRNMWNTVLAILLLYTATVMPFRLAFIEESESGSWLFLEYVVNFLFFIDFIVNCFSAYYDMDGKVVSDRREILINYLKGWMIVDLIACIPFSLIDDGTLGSASPSGISSKGYNSLIRLVRVPRLYRLFRVSRLFKALKQQKEYSFLSKVQDFVSLKHSAMRLISFFLTVLVCVHLMSCLWYFTAMLQEFSPDCWVYQFGFQDDDTFTLYVACFYWAFTTLTTVGYGDISANTSLERIIAVLWMMFGVCFFSFTIGSLTSMITNIDTKETVLNNKLAIIDEFARESKLDHSIRSKLRHAIRYLSEKTGFSWSDKQNIFNELPKNLRYEVAMAMHQGAIRTIPFFDDKNEVFIATVVPFLLPMQAAARSLVYKETDYADEIYFISKGCCAMVMKADGQYMTVKKIPRGSYFGEIEIIFDIPRKYTVQAVTECDLLVMSKALLEVINDEFRGTYHQIVEIAETRDVLNQRAIHEMRELLKIKKKENLARMEVHVIRDKIRRKTEKFTPERRSSSRITTAATRSDAQSPQSDRELLSRSGTIKDKLVESEKRMRLIKEMLSAQNQFLRTSSVTRKFAVLPPLIIPEKGKEMEADKESPGKESGSEARSEESGRGTPHFSRKGSDSK